MSQQIDAIYDHGVFKPLVPLDLPNKARVKLTVDSQTVGEPEQSTPGRQEAGPEGRVTKGSEVPADFDAGLDALLFDGPTLPADFSRADIYADHD